MDTRKNEAPWHHMFTFLSFRIQVTRFYDFSLHVALLPCAVGGYVPCTSINVVFFMHPSQSWARVKASDELQAFSLVRSAFCTCMSGIWRWFGIQNSVD